MELGCLETGEGQNLVTQGHFPENPRAQGSPTTLPWISHVSPKDPQCTSPMEKLGPKDLSWIPHVLIHNENPMDPPCFSHDPQ